MDVKLGWKYIVEVENDVIKEVTEVHYVRFTLTRESIHPAKREHIVCLQEEYLPVKIGKDWTTLAVEVSEEHHHKKIIYN